jgi:hypothetical protein
MNKTEALRLADELESSVGTQSTYSAMQQAAAELRRLHGLDFALRNCEQALKNMATKYMDTVDQRDALLEALKEAEENGCATVYSNEDDECGAKGCCGVVSYKPHADDCWVTTARAAIKAVEETK